jgi:alpha-beta hydrolase superfamily lysophospholipase
MRCFFDSCTICRYIPAGRRCLVSGLFLLAAGDGDPVGDMGKGVHAAAELLRSAGVACVDEMIYPGMRHEIHNEVDKARVYDDIATWMETHIG